MTKRLEDLRINEYQLVGGPLEKRNVTIERRSDVMWAICSHGLCMDDGGEWNWEPRPSEWTDDFLATTRFFSPREALDVWNKYHGDKEATVERT